KAIGIDMLFVDRGPPDGDKALVAALQRNPAVIGAAAIFADSTQTLNGMDGILSDIPTADSFLTPLPEFAAAAASGAVNVATDQVGTPRAVPMVVSDGHR